MNATKLKRMKRNGIFPKKYSEAAIRERNNFKQNSCATVWNIVTKNYFKFNEEGC